MTIKVGDYRRFHNDGDEPGEPHTITRIDEDVVWYVYDSGDQATWQLCASDDAGSYEECTEEAIRDGMSESVFQPGDRVVATCHQVHTTFGGLVTESHEHHGRVQSISVHDNVWVDLDDSTGPASKWSPASLRREVLS